jgi:hypothetical protein
MSRTGQDVLNLMEVLFPEGQFQSGQNGVVKGLIALNAAQYYFESLMAIEAEIMGDSTGIVTTVIDQETTPFPPGVLRIDRLQLLDVATQRPVYDLIPIRRTGGHITSPGWPANLLSYVTSTGGMGKPTAYYTDARNIYWVARPNAIYNVRWYGFQAAGDITVGSTFPYDDRVMLPLATFAIRLIRTGLDDPIENYADLAETIFRPTIKMLSNYKREQAAGYEYTSMHVT